MPSTTPQRPKVTLRTLQKKKARGEPITMLTAYDYPTARLVDEAGIDIILVGDSVGMVVLGYDTTLPVTMEEMLHHTKAVTRARPAAFVVADMPLGSFQVDDTEAVYNALRFIKEAGADAVKIEGGRERVATVHRMVQAQIPVMGHIGLTPQSYLLTGGFVRPGRSEANRARLLEDAESLQEAGCFAIVLECLPPDWARAITERLTIPTIGIGSGPDCDGQVLVFHDLVGLTPFPPPSFAFQFLNAYELFRQVVEEFRTRVENRTLFSSSPTASEKRNASRSA